jgi:aryl-alcohol dehydrogenase-like predicted oxidoreductase
MDYTTLGRTGMKVSVMGIGCGGPIRMEQRSDRIEAESIAIIQFWSLRALYPATLP